VACGVVGIVGGVIALFALGGADPLTTVWEYRDERASATPAPG
jgi:hypothetical protein